MSIGATETAGETAKSKLSTGSLLVEVYDELRKLAQIRLASEHAERVLQPTALVHEVYLRLSREEKTSWKSQAQFFSAAAEAMRRILVEEARKRMTIKRGGGGNHPRWTRHAISLRVSPSEVLEIHSVLDDLAEHHPVQADLVKLRYFVGMTHQESARALGISRSTADRYWAFAKAWIHNELYGDSPSPRSECPKPR